MIRDTLRAILIVAVVAAVASIAVEARYQMATIDAAHRAVLAASAAAPGPAGGWRPIGTPEPEAGRLRRFGRSALDLADAALGVVR
jgi:hypothetical protein